MFLKIVLSRSNAILKNGFDNRALQRDRLNKHHLIELPDERVCQCRFRHVTLLLSCEKCNVIDHVFVI